MCIYVCIYVYIYIYVHIYIYIYIYTHTYTTLKADRPERPTITLGWSLEHSRGILEPYILCFDVRVCRSGWHRTRGVVVCSQIILRARVNRAIRSGVGAVKVAMKRTDVRVHFGGACAAGGIIHNDTYIIYAYMYVIICIHVCVCIPIHTYTKSLSLYIYIYIYIVSAAGP